MNNVYCGNCGKRGHMYKKCKEPVTSLGIIMFNDKKEYLIVCRRHSIGFVDFIRGKYDIDNLFFIQKLFDDMTNKEIELILNNNFETLWNNLWMKSKFPNKSKIYYLDFHKAKNYFERININKFIDNKKTFYETPEWGFPKGRREIKESDIDAAIREFCEETGFKSDDFDLINNKTYIEEYTGYNGINYRHIYYIAQPLLDKKLVIDPDIYSQIAEISGLKWCSFSEAISLFRPRQIQKKKLLHKINTILNK